MQHPSHAQLETLRDQYSKNFEVAKTFWEWRHKLLTFGATASSILLVLASGSAGNPADRWSRFLAGLAGAAVGMAVAAMDKRNADLLNGCYAYAEQLEESLPTFPSASGSLTLFHEFRKTPRASYTIVIRTLFGALALASLVSGVRPFL